MKHIKVELCSEYENGKLKHVSPFVCWPMDLAESTISWFLFGIKVEKEDWL
jgi:hypothetical protein